MEAIAKYLQDKDQESVSTNKAWTRLLMGFTGSPFAAVRHFYHAEEFVIGDHREETNPLRWDVVIFNLPGMKTFDPRLPWVYLWDEINNSISGTIVTFVDDGRGAGRDLEHAWQIGRRYATRLQYLGIQHATRKLRPPTRRPGAWAGMLVRTTTEEILVSVTLSKWNKMKTILNRIKTMLDNDNIHELDYKQLEKDRGFMVHLAMTYIAINPFLKGIHLTLDSI